MSIREFDRRVCLPGAKAHPLPKMASTAQQPRQPDQLAVAGTAVRKRLESQITGR